MEMADPVSTIASVGWSLIRALIRTGEDVVDGFITLLGTPPSCDPATENFEALDNHECYDLVDHI